MTRPGLNSGAEWDDAATFPRPHFVIIGTDRGDGLIELLASTKLDKASLTQKGIQFTFGPMFASNTIYLLTVDLLGFTVVHADTYDRAFRHLFDEWSPAPEPDVREIGGAP